MSIVKRIEPTADYPNGFRRATPEDLATDPAVQALVADAVRREREAVVAERYRLEHHVGQTRKLLNDIYRFVAHESGEGRRILPHVMRSKLVPLTHMMSKAHKMSGDHHPTEHDR